MTTLTHIFALYGFIMFLGMIAFTILFGRDMYSFARAEVFPSLLIWWRTKGAAIIVHQLGLWFFFVALFSLVWVLDANGLIWFY